MLNIPKLILSLAPQFRNYFIYKVYVKSSLKSFPLKKKMFQLEENTCIFPGRVLLYNQFRGSKGLDRDLEALEASRRMMRQISN